VRESARRLVAAAVPVGVVVVLWSRLERPPAVAALVGIAALGLAPTLVHTPRRRLAVAAGALVAGLSVAFDVSPVEVLPWTRGTWIGSVLDAVAEGLRTFERVAPPFDPVELPLLHSLVLGAVLCFSIVIAVGVASRRPIVASGAVVVAGGWATASVPSGHELLAGAALLVAALWPFAAMSARTSQQAATVAVSLSIVAATAVGVVLAGGHPDDPYLDWKGWSVLGRPSAPVGVRYVWDAQYDGIRFPSKRTTVLRIRAQRTSRYWRASTLDVFTADRWLEGAPAIATVPHPSGTLPIDGLVPAAADDRRGWLKQQVEVVALDDDRLVGAGRPMRVAAPGIPGLVALEGGLLRAPPSTIGPGTRYEVWSYAPEPLPRDLLASPAVYPEETGLYLRIDRTTLEPFGVPGRERQVDRLFTDDLYFAMHRYRPVWDVAKDVTRGASTPYEATLAIERFFRTRGGFRYEERPPRSSQPPLVDFVAGHRAGYCQHFAGAMALMLRMLGVPARVAVGFTSGRWADGVWDVADSDAHAWVEAWFAGYGWVTFDPTPGRGTLTAGYTFASDSADAIRALGRGALLDVVDFDSSASTGRTATPVAATADAQSQQGTTVAIVALSILAALVSLVCLKALRRRLRYLTRDPRRRAGAIRSELVEVLRDQRIPVRPGAGLSEVRVATERGVGVPSGALIAALGRARFGPPEGAMQGATDARRELRRVRTLMRERLGYGRRLRGALSLRSLRPVAASRGDRAR
jgi:transglutaminase-like putative cysteine protease